MKQKILTFFMLVSLVMLPLTVFAQTRDEQVVPLAPPVVEQVDQKVPVSVFVRDDCAHCKDEKAFLEKLTSSRDDIELIYIDIYTDEGRALFDQVTEKEGLSKSTPITLVGNVVIQGYGTDETTGKRIEALIDQSVGKDTLTFTEFLDEGGSAEIETVADGTCDEEACDFEDNAYLFDLPFFGPTDLSAFSLPVMASVLGLIDGFNPCAMWVLVTFLIILLQVGDRKKMLQIAGLFILAETIMYYLILNVWFTTWDFVGLDHIVTPIIGLVAIGGGCFFLYEAYTSDGTCQVTNLEQRAKIQSKIKDIVSKPMTWITALGVIGLAFSVNIIEFACSIGIPQAFTKVIEINQLGFWESQFLMFLYILFYMIDDFIVFGIAFYGADKLHLTTKYSKYSNAVGGVLMLILGLLLIFAPEMLRF